VFQSTRPRGARPVRLCRSYPIHYVSIHAPAGGATDLRAGVFALVITFQSTRPRGARLIEAQCAVVRGVVSIHAPAGGATLLPIEGGDCLGCFNPRARGGRDSRRATKTIRRKKFQSTRPRGARLDREKDFLSGDLFQSTRPRGARLDREKDFLSGDLFQSTRPRGARLLCLLFLPCPVAVSIHAPAGGATVFAHGLILCYNTFQSTRPRGARPTLSM